MITLPILFSLMTDPFLCPTFRLCQSLTTSPFSRGSLTMHRPPVRSPGPPVADSQTHEESRRWKNSLQNRRVSITDRAAGRTDQPRVRRRRGGLSEREKTCRVERWTLDRDTDMGKGFSYSMPPVVLPSVLAMNGLFCRPIPIHLHNEAYPEVTDSDVWRGRERSCMRGWPWS